MKNVFFERLQLERYETFTRHRQSGLLRLQVVPHDHRVRTRFLQGLSASGSMISVTRSTVYPTGSRYSHHCGSPASSVTPKLGLVKQPRRKATESQSPTTDESTSDHLVKQIFFTNGNMYSATHTR